MTRFIDGPAKGICLSLARSPMFLRVVRDVGTGKCVILVEWEPPSADVRFTFHFHGRIQDVVCRGTLAKCFESLGKGMWAALRAAVGKGAAQDLVSELSLVLNEIQRRLIAAKE